MAAPVLGNTYSGSVSANSTLTISSVVADSDKTNIAIFVDITTWGTTGDQVVSSVSWGGGGTASLVGSQDGLVETGETVRTTVWKILGVTPGASGTITVNTVGTGFGIDAFVHVWGNVDQTTPTGTPRGVTHSPLGANFSIGAWLDDDGDANKILWGTGSVNKFNITALTLSTADIPDYLSVGTAVQSAGATTLTPGAPGLMIPGDLDVASIATENNATIGVSGSGWAQVGSTVAQDSTWQVALFARRYDGTNVNPVFSWTGSVGCSARRWAYRRVKGAGSTGTATGTSSTHAITGGNATANNSLVVYIDHAEANTALGSDAGYTERFDAGSATGPYRLAVGDRDQATSGAGADNFSATGASASWVLRLVELLARTNTQTIANYTDPVAGSSGYLAAWHAYQSPVSDGDSRSQFAFTQSNLAELYAYGSLAFSINGTNAISGTLAVTLGALTASGSGAVPHTASLSATLGAATVSGVGTVLAAGTAAGTLGALTLSGSGTVANTVFTGTLSVTLGAMTASASGVVPHAATLSATLGAVTLSASGGSPNTASLAVTLGAMTLAAFGGEGFDITDYGASTGSSDNTSAINSALAAAYAAGSFVIVPVGNFQHAGLLDCGNVRIIGYGAGSILTATVATDSALMVDGDLGGVLGLKIVGPGGTRLSEYDACGIAVLNATNFTISNVIIEDSSAAGMHISGSSLGVVCYNRLSGTKADSIHFSNFEGPCHDVQVFGNRVDTSGDDGIAVVSYAPDPGDPEEPSFNIYVRNNSVVDQVWGRGYSVVGGHDVVIEHNYFSNNTADFAAIYISAEAEYETLSSDNVLVRDNTIDQAGGNHGSIQLYASSGTVTDVTIDANSIYNSRNTNIILNGAGGQSGIVISNNVTYGTEDFLFDDASASPTLSNNTSNGPATAPTLAEWWGEFTAGTFAATLGAVTVAGSGAVLAKASGAATLGALTLSASGTVANQVFTGTLSATLGALSLAGAGAALAQGVGAAALGALTVSGVGGIPAAGAGAATLGALTLSASGTVANQVFTGTLAVTLDALAASGSGSALVQGAGAATLGALALAGTGTVENQVFSGALAVTLGDLAAVGVGDVLVQGVGAGAMAALTVSGVGSLPVLGAGDGALGALTLSASGTVENTVFEGGLAVTLGDLVLAGVAGLLAAGSLDEALGGILLEAQGAVYDVEPEVTEGSLAVTLGDLVLEAEGILPGVSGSLAATLGAVSLGGAAAVPALGTLGATFDSLDLVAAGASPVRGSLAVSLGAVTLLASTEGLTAGSLAVTLGALSASAAGAVAVSGALDATLGDLVAVGAGAVRVAGAGAVALGALTLAGSGTVADTVSTGTLGVTLGDLEVLASGQALSSGVLDVTLFAVTASSSGASPARGQAAIALGALGLSAAGEVFSVIAGPRSISLTATMAGTSLAASAVMARRVGMIAILPGPSEV